MKKFIINHWQILTLVLLSPLILWPLFQAGYFPHHDDLQVIRLHEMRRCFEDGQIPCRWVPDMGYGFGYPMFNFYSVFPYYLVAPLTYIFGYIISAKILFFLPLIIGGISMYLFAKELFSKNIGFVVAILYMFAPYRALDSYVRGAIAESFALAIAPFIFYFLLKLIRNNSKLSFIGLSLSLAALFTTHNIMTLFFTPVVALFGLLYLYFDRFKSFKRVFLSGLLGFGLAAFFLLPAYSEKSLVQIDTLKQMGTEFRAHFVTFGQLFFDRAWGYGGSFWGQNDTISFQIGWPHWWLVIIAGLLVLVILVNQKLLRSRLSSTIINKVDARMLCTAILFLGVFLFSIFMTHNKSAFVWELSDTLQFAQFPWRFLSLTIFAASILGGFIITTLVGKTRMVAGVLIIVLAIALNWQYFVPEKFFPQITDQDKFTGDLWDIQQKAGIHDYLPNTAHEPKNPAPKNGNVISGKAVLNNWEVRSNRWGLNVDVTNPSVINVPVFDFPNWTVRANGQTINHNFEGPDGTINFYLNPGSYKIEGSLENTQIRTLANFVTLFSFAVLIALLLKPKRFFKD